MKEALKSIGSGIGGIIILCFILMIPAFFIWGGVKLSKFIIPWLMSISGIVFIINVLIFLPLAIFKTTRGFSGMGMMYSSIVYGVTLWIWGFLLTYILWGGLALIIGLFLMGVGVVPIAMLATMFNGMWSVFGQLIFLLFLTFGSRFFGAFLAGSAEEASY